MNKGKGKDKSKKGILNNAINDLSSNLTNFSSNSKKMSSREVKLRSRSLFKLMNDKDVSTLDFRDALLFRLNDIKKYGILNMLNIFVNFGKSTNILRMIYLCLSFFIILYTLMRIFQLNFYSSSDIIFISVSVFSYFIFLYFKLSKEVQIVFPFLKYIYFGKYRFKKEDN